MKKIYSAVDADELKVLLDKGSIIKGFFGDSLNGVNNSNEWLTLSMVEDSTMVNRFHDSEGFGYALFKVESISKYHIIEDFTKYEGKEVNLKASLKIELIDGYTNIVKIGDITVGGFDLLDYFELVDGSVIGELKEEAF